MVPCWNKIISDPSCRRWLASLKLFYFARGSIMKWNKTNFTEWAGFSSLSNVFASSWAEFTGAVPAPPGLPRAAWWRLQTAPGDGVRRFRYMTISVHTLSVHVFSVQPVSVHWMSISVQSLSVHTKYRYSPLRYIKCQFRYKHLRHKTTFDFR